jgi:hypothetical protein
VLKILLHAQPDHAYTSTRKASAGSASDGLAHGGDLVLTEVRKNLTASHRIHRWEDQWQAA